jgi:hypothetical protein
MKKEEACVNGCYELLIVIGNEPAHPDGGINKGSVGQRHHPFKQTGGYPDINYH